MAKSKQDLPPPPPPISNDISTPSDNASPTPAFTLFPKLPKELQLMIWTHAIAISGPRIITLEPRYRYKLRSRHGRQAIIGVQQSNPSIPSLLHSTRDSRAVALKLYSLCNPIPLGHPLYIDFQHDTLQIAGYSAFEQFTTADNFDKALSSKDAKVYNIYRKLRFLTVELPSLEEMMRRFIEIYVWASIYFMGLETLEIRVLHRGLLDKQEFKARLAVLKLLMEHLSKGSKPSAVEMQDSKPLHIHVLVRNLE